jgi:Ca2+-transporting ATPase
MTRLPAAFVGGSGLSFTLHKGSNSIEDRNMWLWGAFAWTFVLTCGVIFVPVLRGLFGFTAIYLQEFLIALAMAFTIIPVTEVVKAVQRARMKKTAG